MTGDAVPIQYGLNMSPKINNLGRFRNWLDEARTSFQRKQPTSNWVRRRLGPMFMAADATGYLTRLDRDKTLHFLYGMVIFVQGDKEKTAFRRNFHVRRTVGFDRNRSLIYRVKVNEPHKLDSIEARAYMKRGWKLFQYQQLLDLPCQDLLPCSSLASHRPVSSVLCLSRQPFPLQ